MSDAAERAAELAEKKLAPPIELADASPPWLSDDALAQKFAERHGNDLRYIALWSHWYEWDGARWAREGHRVAPTWRRLADEPRANHPPTAPAYAYLRILTVNERPLSAISGHMRLSAY